MTGSEQMILIYANKSTIKAEKRNDPTTEDNLYSLKYVPFLTPNNQVF